MKKIFTLFAGLLMSVALFAADRRPVVTVKKAMNYKIVIDGRSYFDNDMTMKLSNLQYGRHTIKVYEIKKGLFARERMVAAAAFKLDRDDVTIKIDRFGKIDIKEKDNDRGWNGRDDRRDDHNRF
ncbi:MAG TPA: hypothetical protein VGO58_12870 [Chitinophagaceae bacterium]|jgi:hypothetical protein|nr:hypothetical protein [Chitinophagaceae bacterium]